MRALSICISDSALTTSTSFEFRDLVMGRLMCLVFCPSIVYSKANLGISHTETGEPGCRLSVYLLRLLRSSWTIEKVEICLHSRIIKLLKFSAHFFHDGVVSTVAFPTCFKSRWCSLNFVQGIRFHLGWRPIETLSIYISRELHNTRILISFLS